MNEKYLVTALRFKNGDVKRVFVKGKARESYSDIYTRLQTEVKQYSKVEEFGKVFKWVKNDWKEYKPKKENEK